MFGPDKCGSTNKMHFILKHKNPKTGEYVEHHLKSPPSVPYDKLSHIYTAILKPDNELRVLIDGEEKSKANFLSSDDFEPALIPSKTIHVPDDKKPEDWDEGSKIPAPELSLMLRRKSRWLNRLRQVHQMAFLSSRRSSTFCTKSQTFRSWNLTRPRSLM